MSESPSIMLRNTRKHFLKCVDCGGQTLPQNASQVRPWTAAASLYIGRAVNDGALCFNCANKRREKLGLPVEKEHGEVMSPARIYETKLKRVRINTHEYVWEINTLESLLTKWREECLAKTFRNRNINHFIVAVNNEVIPASAFSALPISDGDMIDIAVGAISGG
ncbi:MAG: hypothetical protein WCC92_16590 [Candidatus Korobacteraceae bacterium]